MIEHLIAELGISPGLCVEFGAWDGKHLSNTWNLWAQHDWRALLIEPDARRFALLQQNTAGFNVTCLPSAVGTDDQTSLDTILATHCPGEHPDLLSIDIDGDDYWIWAASEVTPAIVVIEYNASFPPETEFVQTPGSYTGSSAAAFVSLARTKRYTLVDLTQTNLIFVRDDLVQRLTVSCYPLMELLDRRWVPAIHSDLHGVHHLTRPAQWGFAGIRVDFSQQRLTGRLRHFVVAPAKRLSRSDASPAGPILRWLEDRYVRYRSRRPPS